MRSLKTVLRGHLYGYESAYQEASWISHLCAFCAALGFEECKTSPPSKNTINTSLFCANSKYQSGRNDKIRSFWVDDVSDEDVIERVVEVANYFGLMISKQDISVSHRLLSRNPGLPIIENSPEVKPTLALWHRKEFKKNSSIKSIYWQCNTFGSKSSKRPDVNYVNMLNEKRFSTVQQGKASF